MDEDSSKLLDLRARTRFCAAYYYGYFAYFVCVCAVISNHIVVDAFTVKMRDDLSTVKCDMMLMCGFFLLQRAHNGIVLMLFHLFFFCRRPPSIEISPRALWPGSKKMDNKK